MKKIFNRIIFSVIISAAFLGGCRSTEEYQRLSRAGTLYVQSLDTLLKYAGDIKIDTTSEQLLQDDRILNRNQDYYKERTNADIERLKILEDLRRHNRLLARYFVLLDELASSDAPERAQQEIGGIVGNINKIGNKLRKSNLIEDRETSIIGAIGKLIISSQIEGALREELEARAETINKELETQEVLLDVLGDSINNELKITAESIQTRLIIRPYIQEEPIVKEDDWITTRKSFNQPKNCLGTCKCVRCC